LWFCDLIESLLGCPKFHPLLQKMVRSCQATLAAWTCDQSRCEGLGMSRSGSTPWEISVLRPWRYRKIRGFHGGNVMIINVSSEICMTMLGI
jgi:hypothetical protein